MSKSLADILEIWGFDGDFIVYRDASIGFMLECVPVDVSTWSDDRLNSYADRIGQFLNSLSAHTDIQFIQDIEPGNDRVIKAHEQLSANAKNEVARSLCLARVERLKKQDEAGMLPVHSLKIVVRRPFSQNLLERPKLFSKEKHFEEIAGQRLAREIQAAERLRDTLRQGLEILEIGTRTYTADEVARILYQQWNPSRGVPFRSYNPEEVRESLLFSDVGIDLKGFVIGTTHFRVLSLKILPDQTYSAMAASLRELPFKSRLLLSVHVPDQLKEIESLQTQRRIAYSMVVGKKSGVSDLESQAKLQDLESLLEQMIASGQKVFHVSLTILLQSEAEEELEAQVDHVLAKFRELGGAEALTETLAAFEIFSQAALPNARTQERARKVKTSNLCDLLPLYGPWPGHSTPSVLLKSRMGSLISFSPFDPSLSSGNMLISGGSGSGKSALTNFILMNMLKESCKAYLIDIGGSYRKLTENLGGQYIELGVSEGLSINPFDLLKEETAPSPHKIKFLVGLVELMTKEEGAERLPRLARAEVEEAVAQVYRQHAEPRLSNLRDLLLAHPDQSIQTYGKILTPWCGETPFGRFIDRKTTVEFERDVVAFDLKNLESYPDLQVVCLYLITDLVWREVQRDRSQMKFIVFDECWKLLKDEAGQIFIEEVFRTVRKYFCSAIALSQSLVDFLSSKISSALIPNCPVKWILLQNQSDFTQTRDALGLNENEVALIQSLRQEKGEYSEAFLVAGSERHVVAVIEPTPLELWIATTDPKDLAKIEEMKREAPHLSQLEILKQLAADFPRGAGQRPKVVS